MSIVQKDGMQWLEYYLENSPAVFFKWRNAEGWPVEYVSANVLGIFGYSQDDFLQSRVIYADIIHPDDLASVTDEVASIERSLSTELTHQPYRIIRRDGQVRWVSDHTKVMRNANGVIEFYNGYIIDITEQELIKQELSSNLLLLKKQSKLTDSYFNALNQSYILSISDIYGNITYVNDNLCQICGYRADELIGQPHSILRHPDVPKETFKSLWETISAKKAWHGQIQNRAKNGQAYYVQMTILPLLDETGTIEQYIAIRYDITEQIRQREHIDTMSWKSLMTGLPNLYALVHDIEKFSEPNLAIVNIDGFKIINNLFGYQAGDEVIRALGKLLVAEFSDIKVKIYHIHADEFGILTDGYNFDLFIHKLEIFQKSLHSKGIASGTEMIPLHVSVACSNEPHERLLSSCNMAVHFARAHHLKFVRYDKTIDFSKDYSENLRWTKIMHDAISNHGIRPFFQPIYNIRDNSITKYEALMRIEAEGKIYTPYHFMEIAKNVKLYIEISVRMLEETFKTIQNENYTVSINLSFEDILSPVYKSRLFELLGRPRKGNIVLEIVESEGIGDYTEVNEFILRAKELGCRIAIDDFGAGFSNFEYLLKLNADFIKIDGSLIRNIDRDFDSEAIVRTIATFAQIKKIPIIAEFVHCKAVLDKITEIGIEFAQGYYIGEPADYLSQTLPER